ncbi:MAG: hypothetical protein GXP62_17605 [Oligoflexia bacterium]|nr:hypothetical protein [Oligoflexia bacterium]
MITALALALAGFLLSHGVITWYFLVINREKVPVSVGPFAGAILCGMALSIAALVLGPSWTTGVMGAINLGLGSGILWLLTLRKLPNGHLIATVGQPMPPLSATDDTGAVFDLAGLKGRRLMVKFFRGSW